VPVNLDRGTARERFKLRWNQEDPAPNLSVIAMLRREHAITPPEWEDQEDLDPEVYCESVTAAISDQPRWAVEPNDVVVGFFSFAKFLMYRDLDAEHWPEHAAIDGHAIVSALLGDGFAVADRLLPEEGNLDEHLPSATTLHVLDADSSQSVVIEEARRGAIWLCKDHRGPVSRRPSLTSSPRPSTRDKRFFSSPRRWRRLMW
jgi:hypothetical protein